MSKPLEVTNMLESCPVYDRELKKGAGNANL